MQSNVISVCVYVCGGEEGGEGRICQALSTKAMNVHLPASLLACQPAHLHTCMGHHCVYVFDVLCFMGGNFHVYMV